MKKNSLSILFLFLIFSIQGQFISHAAENPWDTHLPFEHATIHYEITGMETGEETLFIKDFGNHRALHHNGTTSLFGITTKTRRVQITDPQWQYTFDLEEGTGTRITNPKNFFQQEYDKLSAAEKENVNNNAEELGLSMVKDFNGQVEVNAATLLGYSCDRTTISGMTVYVIHKTDIPLRTEVDFGMMKGKTVATNIDQAVPTPQSFALPDNIEPVFDAAADELSRQMAAKYVATLKEPDGAERMRAQMREDAQRVMPLSENPSVNSHEEQAQELNGEKSLQEDMHKGLDMLQGLFGK